MSVGGSRKDIVTAVSTIDRKEIVIDRMAEWIPIEKTLN